jgi:hypothetical protein
MTINDAVLRTGLSERWIRQLIKRHGLPVRKVPCGGGGRYVFSHDNVSQILRIHYANQERLEHLYPALYKATGKHRRNPSTAMRRRGALR